MRHCNIFRPLTAFELLLTSNNGKKLLFKVYNILLMDLSITNKAKLNWERGLGMVFSEDQWFKLKNFNHTFSGNVSIQENRFKLMNW